MTVKKIMACDKINGWYIVDGKKIKLGNDVTLGDSVKLGNRVTLGNGVKLGDNVTLGDSVKLGNGVKLGDSVTLGDSITLGDWVTLGNGVSSTELNKLFIDNLRKQYGDKFLATKWVTSKRKSPFHCGATITYTKGQRVTVDAVISDQQCAKGLHVLPLGHRPEWYGLCEANHDYIPITVEILVDDVCFAGLPTMNNKLRVRSLLPLE